MPMNQTSQNTFPQNSGSMFVTLNVNNRSLNGTPIHRNDDDDDDHNGDGIDDDEDDDSMKKKK